MKSEVSENTTETSKTVAEQHEAEHAMGGTYHSDTVSQLRQDPRAISALFKEGKYPYTCLLYTSDAADDRPRV